MSTTMEQVRSWNGPALFSYGFRPFFLASGVWGVLLMVLWLPMLSGSLELPTAFDAVSWHAHEFLWGYLSAVLGGFLLTAIPNWTGRMPIVGRPLMFLFFLWILGRSAILLSAYLPALLVALVDVAMPVALGVACLREIVSGKNWRNLVVLVLLGLFVCSNLVFHWEAAHDDYAAQGYGLRLGVSTMLMMVGLIGGRILPSFTRNWLVKAGSAILPSPPMQRFDRVSLLALAGALFIWTVFEDHWLVAISLLLAGVLHLVRLMRWKGWLTWTEPLVLVLHVSYAFLPLGLMATGIALMLPHQLDLTGSQHLLMAGVMGMMTVAVMTRATLGHTGQPLRADGWSCVIYIALLLSVVLRFTAGILPDYATPFYHSSGALWILSYLVFCARYGPKLLAAQK